MDKRLVNQEEARVELPYSISCEQDGESTTVFLKLAISDTIGLDKYENLVSSNCRFYQITILEPSPHGSPVVMGISFPNIIPEDSLAFVLTRSDSGESRLLLEYLPSLYS